MILFLLFTTPVFHLISFLQTHLVTFCSFPPGITFAVFPLSRIKIESIKALSQPLTAFTMAANQIPSSIYFNPEWSYRYNSEFFLELPVRSKKDFLRLTLEPYALHKANPYLS